jgi:hypothetical protein
MFYIPYEGNILGLSLSLLEYMHIPRKKVLERLKDLNVKLIEDDNRLVFKLLKQLGNKKYAIPYFISS